MKSVILALISLLTTCTTAYSQLSVGTYAGGNYLYYNNQIYIGARSDLQKIQLFTFPQMEDENVLLLPSKDKNTLYIFGRSPWGKWIQIEVIYNVATLYEVRVVRESATGYFIYYQRLNGDSESILIGSSIP